MTYYDRILNRVKNGKDKLPLLEKWIASGPSLQPAAKVGKDQKVFHWKPKVGNSQEALSVLFLSLFKDPWNSWEIIEQIKQTCYFQRYNGNWQRVQEILETDSDRLSTEEKIELFVLSEDDFFGNFLRTCEQYLKRNPKGVRVYSTNLRKPKKPVLRRGYKDKGLQRPLHQKGRNLPDPEPGEDRRNKVKFGSLP